MQGMSHDFLLCNQLITKSCARHGYRDNNMKKAIIIAICAILSSCATSNYYQMYQTKPISENVKVKNNAIVYEDDYCIISYDFWKEGGDIGFIIYNKNTDNLYLHLDECFFVKNGYAYDYYQNRTYSRSKSVSASSSSSYSYGNSYGSILTNGYANAYSTGSKVYGSGYGSSNTYKNGYIASASNAVISASSNTITTVERKIICIPPQTSKAISEFNISSSIYHDCDLYLNPGKKDYKFLTFSQDNSPLTFGNIIAYSIGDSETLIRFNNDFYISKVSNYSYEEITKLINKEECGKKLPEMKRVAKESGPDQFYNHYKLNSTVKKH